MSTTPTLNERDVAVALEIYNSIPNGDVMKAIGVSTLAQPVASYRAEIESAKDKESDAILKSNERLQAELVKRFERIRTLEKALSEAEKAIEDEPELPGEMPDEIWAMLQTKEGATEVLRANVRATKKSLLTSIRQAKGQA